MRDLGRLNWDRKKWEERKKWLTCLPAWMMFTFAIGSGVANIGDFEDLKHPGQGPLILLVGAVLYLLFIVCFALFRWRKLKAINRKIAGA